MSVIHPTCRRCPDRIAAGIVGRSPGPRCHRPARPCRPGPAPQPRPL